MIPVSPKIRALLCALGAATMLALLPAAADADQYVVDHCQTPDGQPAIAFASITGQTSNDCSAPGGGLHHQEGTNPPTLPTGDIRAIVLAIPADRPNLQIERVITTFSMPGAPPSQPAGPNGFPILQMFNGNGDLIYSVLASATPTRPTLDLTLPPNDRALTWRVLCGGSACTFFDQNILNVYANRLFLNEAVAPTLTITGGTLAGAGSKSGQMSLAFDASDTDSGVSSVAVTLGAIAVGGVKFPCVSHDWSACPRDEKSQLLQVDTTKVPDGDQELVVTVRDAANNALTRSLGFVAVANGGGPPVPNGTGASRLAKLSARFTTTARSSRRLGYASSPTIRGTLADETGKPIAGATVAVLSRLRQSGADAAQIASVPAGADGRFAYKLPGGPSRTITFAYTAFSGDAKPAATATLKTTVRAIVSARISPRSVRPGASITLSGRLRLLPRKGVEITIQARQGRAWRTVDGVRTSRDGSFRWRYRFAASQSRRTYVFRARVASPIYPFAAADSKPAPVRVR